MFASAKDGRFPQRYTLYYPTKKVLLVLYKPEDRIFCYLNFMTTHEIVVSSFLFSALADRKLVADVSRTLLFNSMASETAAVAKARRDALTIKTLRTMLGFHWCP